MKRSSDKNGDFYEVTIEGLKRKLPICRVNDEISFPAFIMFGDVEITETAARGLLRRAPDFDIILTAEAKGIPLAYEMARQSSKSYIVARKGVKLYMKNPLVVDVKSISTVKKQTLVLDEIEAEKLKNKRVLIVDDVISTGESLAAVEYLANRVGGKVVGRMAVLAEGDAKERKDIVFLATSPIIQNRDIDS